jgi:hypothetical protein
MAGVSVCRLTDENNSEHIVGFAADVKINCADCGMPFEFIGLPIGVSATNSKPMVSMDRKELRAPIKPSSDPADVVNSLLNKKA